MNKTLQFQKLCNSLASLYADKQGDYQDSFALTHKEFGPVAALTRISDKLNRAKSLLLRSEAPRFESVQDTLLDLAAYALMLALELQPTQPTSEKCVNTQKNEVSGALWRRYYTPPFRHEPYSDAITDSCGRRAFIVPLNAEPLVKCITAAAITDVLNGAPSPFAPYNISVDPDNGDISLDAEQLLSSEYCDMPDADMMGSDPLEDIRTSLTDYAVRCLKSRTPNAYNP